MALRIAVNVIKPTWSRSIFPMNSVARTTLPRLMSMDTADSVQMTVNDQTGVATIKLNRKPVNSLNLEALTQLAIAVEKIHNDKSIRGLIITSNIPGIFSAGLDIMEFLQPKERLREFWRAVQEVWLQIYGLNMPSVAAINGHAPAGGCMITLCADYRIMATGKYNIGLNETKLGFAAPWWLQETYVKTIGYRKAEHSLQLGLMFDSNSALKIGLVDQVVDESQVYATAEEEITKWIKLADTGRILTKQVLRRQLIDKLTIAREDDIRNTVDLLSRDSTQKLLQGYLESMKKK